MYYRPVITNNIRGKRLLFIFRHLHRINIFFNVYLENIKSVTKFCTLYLYVIK